jgi:amino acid transporter
LILSAISLWKEDFVANEYQTILMFWAVMLVCMCVNIFGAKYLDLINKICIYWTASSVVIILITLLSMADTRRDASFVFAHYDASASGWYVFINSSVYSLLNAWQAIRMGLLRWPTASRLHSYWLWDGSSNV